VHHSQAPWNPHGALLHTPHDRETHTPTSDEALVPHCASLLAARGVPPSARASALGGGYTALPRTVTAMQQCLTEQRYVRGAQLRTLIYNQACVCVFVWPSGWPRYGGMGLCVLSNAWGGDIEPHLVPSAWLATCAEAHTHVRSVTPPPTPRHPPSFIATQVSISGQVLVFVVRTPRHSLSTAAGRLTYLAFAGAQVCVPCVECGWACARNVLRQPVPVEGWVQGAAATNRPQHTPSQRCIQTHPPPHTRAPPGWLHTHCRARLWRLRAPTRRRVCMCV
jgi:hypothetical protein